MDELRQIRESASSEAEKLFLEALFETDGKRAAAIFQNVWDYYPSSPLAWAAMERLYEYYYARGAYIRADSLAQILKEKPRFDLTPAPPQTQNEIFLIQVGAFSDFINAAKLNVKLEGMGYEVELKEKKVESGTLFVVLVGSFNSRIEAEKAAKSLEVELQLKSRVIAEPK